jgi:4-hydroxy-tetrahydrodipicolinate reductase
VDFTIAEVARNNIFSAVDHGIRAVVGTTGFSPDVLSEFADHCRSMGIGAAVIPNFSIGAMLITRWAREAASYFPDVEIIEMHHAAKRDKPSGTALRIARRISDARDGVGQSQLPIHSVRLPGLMAHHQIIFGAGGQTVTISHDALDRSCYCSGVILAVRKVLGLNRAVFDLEDLLDGNDR